MAIVRRYLDPAHVLSLAEADFEPIFRVYAEHVHRWELPLDGLSLTMMREGLAAMALHLVGRPPDESVGVTINVQTPPLNLFLTGDPGERTLTGRVFTEDVRTGSTSRMFVQAFRPATGPMQSTIDVDGLDVLGMFEDYYDRSEQSPARFFELGGDRYGMVKALPDGGADRVRALTAESAAALFAGEKDLLEIAGDPLPLRLQPREDHHRAAGHLRGQGRGTVPGRAPPWKRSAPAAERGGGSSGRRTTAVARHNPARV